jgi:nucleotide-binding universal stress UspA family protein
MKPSAHASGTVRSHAGPDRRPVVVGVESTGDSHVTIEWAAREAASRRAPLTLVHTRAREHALAAGAPDVRIARQRGHAADVLVDLTSNCSLLVVGRHHGSAIARGVFGSVSSHVVSAAQCPVVVLAGAPGMVEEGPSVVAGVSGEAHDQDVLRFAFDYAGRNGFPLQVVFAWTATFGSLRLPPPDVARLPLSEIVAGWRAEYPDVTTHLVVQHGDPVDVLVETSASQALLVVGRHASRMRLGSILGSTSLGVVHHATCPVAVIPPSVAVPEHELVSAAQPGIVTP